MEVLNGLINNIASPLIQGQLNANNTNQALSGIIQASLLTLIIFIVVVTSIIIYYIWVEDNESKKTRIKDTFFIVFGYNALFTVICLVLLYILVPIAIDFVTKADAFLTTSSTKQTGDILTGLIPGVLGLLK